MAAFIVNTILRFEDSFKVHTQLTKTYVRDNNQAMPCGSVLSGALLWQYARVYVTLSYV